MKIILLFLFGFFLTFSGLTQTISGKISEGTTGKPVPFANIGVIGGNLGTASDILGLFSIDVTRANSSDTLRVSCIGYEHASFGITALRDLAKTNGEVTIELVPRTYDLLEVTVKPVKTRIYILGNHCDPESAYGNSFNSRQLGTEIGVAMELPRGRYKAWLKSFRFYVGEFSYDGAFPVRMNIYTFKDSKPDENILHEPVFIEIDGNGEYLIDLEQYNLVVTSDFFVSLEYYRVMDLSKGNLVFCAVHTRNPAKGNGYFRFVSQGAWRREFAANLGFSVVAECAK
jgi:hypothetical protein